MANITVESPTDTPEEVKAAAKSDEKPPEDSKPAEAGKPEGKPEETAPTAKEEEATKPEAPAGEAEVSEEEKAKTEAAPKPKSGPEKRIHRLTADNQWLKNRVAELTGKGGETTQPAEDATDQEDKKPKVDDFEIYEEFTEALGKWSARQEYGRIQAEDAQRAQDEETKATVDAYNQRAEKARAAHEDFEEVVGQNIEIPISVQMAIIELDNGPEVAYHLGKNPELCKKLNDLSPLKAVAEIGRVSAILAGTAQEAAKPPDLSTVQETGKSPAPKKPASSAPAPIVPVGGGQTKTNVPLDETEMKEYNRRRDAGET